MVSFIVYVFWLLVFLASVFFLAVSLWDNSEDNKDPESFEKKKIIYGLTSIGHLNSWQTVGTSLGCFLAALLSAWFIDIFYLFLWISLFAVGFAVFGILSALGSDEEDFSSSIMRNLKEFNLDKALTYLPTYALVTSFVLIFAINGGGMAEWDDASTSKSSASSSSSSSSSSSKKVSWRLDQNGCPTKNGELYGYSPGQVAGRIFDIAASQGYSIGDANSRCVQCTMWNFNEAIRRYGTTGSVTSPKTELCTNLTTNLSSNRSLWNSMRENKTYRR